jgi:copper(I)-binding protein
LIEEAHVSASRRTNRRVRPGVAALAAGAGVALVLGLTACSAGQITQTATQVAPVPGTNVNVGPLALRNLMIAYNGAEGYQSGSSAPLIVRIFNEGVASRKLVEVSSEVGTVVLVGGTPATPAPIPTTTPPASASASPSPEPTASATGSPDPSASPGASASPSPTPTPSPVPVGQTRFSLEIPAQSYLLLVPGEGQHLAITGLKTALTPGMSARVTFIFDDGSKVESDIPFEPAPHAPRATPAVEHEE